MGYARALRHIYGTDQNRESQKEEQKDGSGRHYLNNSVQRAVLQVGAEGDAAEQEASRIALQVSGDVIQRSAEESAGGDGFTAGKELTDVMGRSSSQSIDPAAAAQIGSRLGADFSGVRIHTDSHAEQAASGIGARAFTKGKDIYFNRGQYDPGTPGGKELLAHELTHTIQQGQVSQSGGIPVTRSASPGTAQRSIFKKLKKNFRRAVDERNNNYEEYKQLSRLERFKWAVKNPLAFMFGRAKANQRNTQKRNAARRLREQNRAALDAFGEGLEIDEFTDELVPGGQRQEHVPANEAVGDAPAAAEREDGEGGELSRLVTETPDRGGRLKDADSARKLEKTGTIASMASMPLVGAGTGLKTLGASISDAANGGMMAAGGAAGIIGGVAEATNAFDRARYWADNGDRSAKWASYLDSAAGVMKIGKGGSNMGAGMLKIGGLASQTATAAAGGFSAVAGGLKMVSSGLGLYRTGKILSRTKELKEDLKGQLENADPRERKRLRALIGFARMGHNTASADRTREGFRMAAGAFDMIGGGLSAGGLALPGAIVGLAGTGLDFIGKKVAKSKADKLKGKEVDKSLNLGRNTQHLSSLYGSQVSEKETRKFLMRKRGFVNGKHAYLELAKERVELLKSLPEAERAKMIRSLKLDPKKASEQAIYERLGLSRKKAANIEAAIDRAIRKETARRNRRRIPSWRS